MRLVRALRLALLLIAFSGLATVVVAEDVNQLNDRLLQLRPTFEAPVADVLDDSASTATFVRLLGVDFHQNSVRLKTAEFDSTKILIVEGFWEPRVPMRSVAPFQITLWDHLGLIQHPVDIRVGPAAREPAWTPGSVYKQRYEIDLADVALAFSGDAFMTIQQLQAAGKAAGGRALFNIPLSIHPLQRSASVEEGRLTELVGSTRHILPTQFRLGFNASTQVAIPEDARQGNGRMVIISSMAYRGMPQGDAVCKVTLESNGKVVHTLDLRSGIDTARCDHDAYEPGKLTHERAPIFASRNSPHLDQRGRPVQLHKFFATYDLPESARNVDTIRLHCLGDVVLDVYGIVLVPIASP